MDEFRLDWNTERTDTSQMWTPNKQQLSLRLSAASNSFK